MGFFGSLAAKAANTKNPSPNTATISSNYCPKPTSAPAGRPPIAPCQRLYTAVTLAIFAR
jgi:hypothetical protein